MACDFPGEGEFRTPCLPSGSALEIMHELKLVDYLHVQVDKSWCNLLLNYLPQRRITDQCNGNLAHDDRVPQTKSHVFNLLQLIRGLATIPQTVHGSDVW